MTRSRNHSLMLLLLTGFCGTLFADVAPPVFPGYSLSPFDAKDVRMKSEKVDIYYGSTCKIVAIFEILNPTSDTVEKKIGFPHHLSAERPWRRGTVDTTSRIYDFAMSLNGENQRETDIPRSRQIQSDKHYWYGWTGKFKPGLNTVKLTYHTLTSAGTAGYRWEKTLYYLLNSDKNWPEKIENVDVTIHFPQKIAPRQILPETSPPGYKIKENEIKWHFKAFTPKPESNIKLQIIDFPIYADMLNYEEVLAPAYNNNAKKLDAAIFFAGLAPSRGIHITAPTFFRRSYYDSTVLPNLNTTERTLFDAGFTLHKTADIDYYTMNKNENIAANDSLRRTVMTVMHRIGYFEKIAYPIIYKYIVGAKRLFREVVESEPKNAAAWKAYIDNYYLIETGACGPCHPWLMTRCDFPESQKQIVLEAFKNCGYDSTIAIWNRFFFPTYDPLPETLEVRYRDNTQEIISVVIQQYDHRGSTVNLSSNQLAIVKKAYSMPTTSILVRNKTIPDEETRKKLVDILGGCNLYRNVFCRDLEKIRKR